MMAYYGLTSVLIENEWLAVEALAEAGPRVVRLTRPGSPENLLGETPEINLPGAYGEYRLYGGHRLWHAPEASERTYWPDDSGVSVEKGPDWLRLEGPQEGATKIRKTIEVRLESGRPAARLLHTLKNEGVWPVELAAWAITMLPLGGKMILPQPVEPGENPLLPNRHLALWPYARLSDERLELGDEFIYLYARPDPQAIKIGYFNPHGWAAYERDGLRLVKRFPALTGRSYPDFGCNVEVYCRDRFTELETLGPLTILQPGGSLEHWEEWEIEEVVS